MSSFRQLAVKAAVIAAASTAGSALAQEGSAGITAVGWWSRSPAQEAPAGGFAVAAAPDGPVTVAAVMVDTGPDGVLSATLEAAETGGVATDMAAVQVCPAAGGWEPEAGGAMDDAPEADCEAATVPFERDADSETWTADLLPLVAGETGPVSLAIVPAEAAEGGLPAVAFDVRFAKPTLDAVANTPVADETPPPTVAEDGPPESAAQPAAPVRDEVGPAPAFVTPQPAVDEPAPTEPPAEEIQDQGRPEREELGPVRPPEVDGRGGGRRWGQSLAYLLTSVAAGCAAGFGRRFIRARSATG